MYQKRIDKAGRVILPSELLDKFGIKIHDYIDISYDEKNILIKKYKPEYVCAVTGKITKKGKWIGEAFISDEGLEEISKVINLFDKKREKV
uniref:Transition state regulatory protein AbrB n=1 Tax=Aeromonas sp. Ne-1 TaxID=1675689 RepID=A0A0H4J992_9GAMM|nr:AbrB/MazE/SpoVT family DNA-binding domain-containing protein [Aeromonas sp. Ne-1]AKO69705.1 transition state regulatory protein AbrB [Aeromonas sp. Ne-1]